MLNTLIISLSPDDHILLKCVLMLILIFFRVCRLEEVVMRSKEVGPVFLPCGQSTIIEMKEGFAGNNVTLPVSSALFCLFIYQLSHIYT